jgi:hypothetical protein
MKNTKLNYVYRDKDKYEELGSVVLSGRPRLAIEVFKKAVQAVLRSGKFFIASQLNIPEVFLWKKGYEISDSDHCWHEFLGLEFTDKAPNDSRTPDQLLTEIAAAHNTGWREFTPSLWRQTNLPGIDS